MSFPLVLKGDRDVVIFFRPFSMNDNVAGRSYQHIKCNWCDNEICPYIRGQLANEP
jgi:hypothetical protein